MRGTEEDPYDRKSKNCQMQSSNNSKTGLQRRKLTTAFSKTVKCSRSFMKIHGVNKRFGIEKDDRKRRNERMQSFDDRKTILKERFSRTEGRLQERHP